MFNPEEMAQWASITNKSMRKLLAMNDATGKLEVTGTKYYSNRPILGKILVLAEYQAIHFQYDKPWAAISITNRTGEHPVLQLENRVNLLQLGFLDLGLQAGEALPTLGSLFGADQAKEVFNFVESVWANVDLLMIHCHAGISRSAAIAQVLSECYQPQYVEHIISLHHPNNRVVARMREEAVNRGLLKAD